MGASKRHFVRSDEEDEASRDRHGDGAGPSTSRRNKRKVLGGQAPVEVNRTAGTSHKHKWLTAVARKETEDSDRDHEESSSNCEEISPAQWSRETWPQKRTENKKENNERQSRRRSSKANTVPLVSRWKRKQKPASQKDTLNQSKGSWNADESHILLGEDFEQLVYDEALCASRIMYSKEVDSPERFQMHEDSSTSAAPRHDWTEEASWIYDRMLEDTHEVDHDEDLKCIAETEKELIIQEITIVLMLLHLEKCEVPVIGIHKFEGCLHLAKRNETKTYFDCGQERSQMKSFKVLWMVYQWDRKWLNLMNYKTSLQEIWKSRIINKPIGLNAEERTLALFIKDLQDADSKRAVDDLDVKFNFIFSTDREETFKGQYKRPKKQLFYSTCCKSGLRQLVKEMTLSAEQLGENLQASEKIHEPLDPTSPPESIVSSYFRGQFTEPQRVLIGARHMAACELSHEPRLRKFARRLFEENAVVSTRPTLKGKRLIDSFHIQAKSVKSFNDGEWLLLQKAEEEELLEVVMELTEEDFSRHLMQRLQTLYFSSTTGETAELWNEQRKLILQEMFFQMIPFLAKEMRLSLMAKAKAWVRAECCKRLWKRVSMAPYPTRDASTDFSAEPNASDDLGSAMVLTCCWGFRNPPTTFVMLNAFGEIVDILQTGYLTVHSGNEGQQLQRKIGDQERLRELILKYEPNIIVLGAVPHPACRHLKDTIAETIGKASAVNPALTSLQVIYGDESLASLYEKSQVSSIQVPKQPGIVRRAVALGRNLQNPLALIAALFNPSKDIVGLSMHPLQGFLSADDLYAAIEHVMVTVTNQVGIDVNLAAGHEWLLSPLQFLCGLGWNKACRIQLLIKESGWLSSRESLSGYPFLLKEIVFRNCSGFLRIRKVGQAVSGLRKIDPLDDTRIHPDHYTLARNLALYSFTDGQVSLESDRDMDMVEQSLLHIRKHPDACTEETVMMFLNSLPNEDKVNLEILKDIRLELLCGFRECRASFSKPTQDEEFAWLTGEDDTSLCQGKAVNAVVQKVFRHRLICTLESGLRGFLEKEDFSTDSNVDLRNVFSEGSILTCLVANVLKDQLSVQLKYVGNDAEACYEGDPLVVKECPYSGEALESLQPSEEQKDYSSKPREIYHPLFQNLSISDAIKSLSMENPGKLIFHPSKEGAACLCMTLKVQDDVYVRKEIEELEKDCTHLAAFSQLGKILKIDGKTYTNLDEVVANYASPLRVKMTEVLQSRLFKNGNDSEIRSYLESERQLSTADDLTCCISVCPNNDVALAVSYMVGENFMREKVAVRPEGYGLHSKIFRKIDTVVSYIRKLNKPPGSPWSGQSGHQYKGRGDGTASGRSGYRQRGPGFQGRGRGNSFSGKLGSSVVQNQDWKCGGEKVMEHKVQVEKSFSTWGAEETHSWNEQKSTGEAFDSRDDIGWTVVEKTTDKHEIGWEANKSTGWGGADRSSDMSQSGWERSSNLKNAGTKGVSNASLDKFENGWEESMSKDNGNSGWGDAAPDMRDGKRQNNESHSTGWQVRANDTNRNIGWIENEAGAEVSKSPKDSGWGDADVRQDKGKTMFSFGVPDSENLENDGLQHAGSSWAALEGETLNKMGNGTGREHSGTFECHRGRGRLGRGGRGKGASHRREGSELKQNDWGSSGQDDKSYTERTFSNWDGKESNQQQNPNVKGSKLQDIDGWRVASSPSKNLAVSGWGADDSIAFASSKNQESGCGADHSKNAGTSGWGADFKTSQIQNEKECASDWFGAERSAATKGTGWGENMGRGGFSETKNDCKWGAGDVPLNLDGQNQGGWEEDGPKDEDKDGWGTGCSAWGGQDKRNIIQKGDRIEQGCSDRFVLQQSSQGMQERDSCGTVNLHVTEKQSKNDIQDLAGWNAGRDVATGNAQKNEKGTEINFSNARRCEGWVDACMQMSANEPECQWGFNSSNDVEMEKSGERTAGSQWNSPDHKEKQKYDRGWGHRGILGSGQRCQGFQGRGRAFQARAGIGRDEERAEHGGDRRGRKWGGRFTSGPRSHGFQGRGGRRDWVSGKWGAKEDKNSRFANTNWRQKGDEQGNKDLTENESICWGEKVTFGASKTQGSRNQRMEDASAEESNKHGWAEDISEKMKADGWGDESLEVREADNAIAKTIRNGKESNHMKAENDWGDNCMQVGKDQCRSGWGDDASANMDRSGWEAANHGWAAQDNKSYNRRRNESGPDQVGKVCSGQGGGSLERDEHKNGFPVEWEAQQVGVGLWNSSCSLFKECREHKEQGSKEWDANESSEQRNPRVEILSPELEEQEMGICDSKNPGHEQEMGNCAQQVGAGLWDSSHSSFKECREHKEQGSKEWDANESSEPRNRSVDILSTQLEQEMGNCDSKNPGHEHLEEHMQNERIRSGAEESDCHVKPSSEVSNSKAEISCRPEDVSSRNVLTGCEPMSKGHEVFHKDITPSDLKINHKNQREKHLATWHLEEKKGSIDRNIGFEIGNMVFEAQNESGSGKCLMSAENGASRAAGSMQANQVEEGEQQWDSKTPEGEQRSVIVLRDGCCQKGGATLSEKQREENKLQDSASRCVNDGTNEEKPTEESNMNQLKTIIAVAKHINSEYQNVEVSGDGFWGACEDLIDRNELEGLMNRSFSTNDGDPQHSNNALQSEERTKNVSKGDGNGSMLIN